MKYVKHFQCTECQKTYSIDEPMNLCPDDGRPVEMILDVESISKDFPDKSWYRPDVNSMWRFGPLLPFDVHAQPDKVVCLGEGHTPCIDISDYSDCKSENLQVFIKDEGQPYSGFGENPTGSFKDRGGTDEPRGRPPSICDLSRALAISLCAATA